MQQLIDIENYLRNNQSFEKKNIDYFLNELSDIGSQNPTLVAFGNDAFDILQRNLKEKFKILKD